MSWRAIARTDSRRLLRSKAALSLSIVFLFAFAGLAGLFVYVEDARFDAYVSLLADAMAVLAPLIGILIGYETISGQRDSGTAALALSLPNSRRSLVVGSLAGRATLVGITIGLGALAAGVALAVAFTGVVFKTFLILTLLVFGYTVVFLTFATALSMLIAGTRRVIVAAFGTHLLLVLGGPRIVGLLVTLLFRLRSPPELPAWAVFATFTSPRVAFSYLTATAGAGTLPRVATTYEMGFISPTVAVLALITWGVVPLALGYRQFKRADL